jgi:hypothetical protein
LNAFVTQVWRDVVRAENPEPEDSGFGRIWPEKVLAKCVVRMPFWSRKFDESGSEIIVASAYVGEVGKAASRGTMACSRKVGRGEGKALPQ